MIAKCATCGVSAEDALLFNEGDGTWKCKDHLVNKQGNIAFDNKVVNDISAIVLDDNKKDLDK
jgi:hypothetical protein